MQSRLGRGSTCGIFFYPPSMDGTKRAQVDHGIQDTGLAFIPCRLPTVGLDFCEAVSPTRASTHIDCHMLRESDRSEWTACVEGTWEADRYTLENPCLGMGLTMQ